ncbi:MAG: hypothetical protein OEZ02_06505 [Anaerolineae bacterium]|nr:hypothetical protein [Anaerolineae bacterium]
MSKKQWWGRFVIGVIVLAVIVAAGYATYNLGYMHGSQASAGESGPTQMMGWGGGFMGNGGHGFRAMPSQGHNGMTPGAMQGMADQCLKGAETGAMPDQCLRGGAMQGIAGQHMYGGSMPSQHFAGTMNAGHGGFFTGVFWPLALVFRVLFFGLFFWVIYKMVNALFGGRGWQLSFQAVENSPADEASKSAKNAKSK